MKLPNAQAARVDYEKLVGYLLSESHPVGRSKARFFRALGFDLDRAGELGAALAGVARSQKVVDRILTPFGTKYVIDGVISGPAGASAAVRTIWIIERGTAAPRLITAYPLE